MREHTVDLAMHTNLSWKREVVKGEREGVALYEGFKFLRQRGFSPISPLEEVERALAFETLEQETAVDRGQLWCVNRCRKRCFLLHMC